MRIHEIQEGLFSSALSIARKLAPAEKEIAATTPKPKISTGDTTPKPRAVPGDIPLSPFRGMIDAVEKKGVKLVDMPAGDKIVQIWGRPIVVVDTGGKTVPFYCSTGGGGKTGVPTGKWYVFFGIGKNGFFNKGWTEEMINAQYHNPEFQRIAKVLDSEIGNVLPHTNRMKEGSSSISTINGGRQPFSYDADNPMSKLQWNAYEHYILGNAK